MKLSNVAAAMCCFLMIPVVQSAHGAEQKKPGSAKAERKANRLANEPSPYLRQHANNPVDWFPWGAEAFAKARRENKPIFLSVGYSTCHWCHVMEKESFSNPQIAAFMNKNFVSIKVDRERRPEVDETYMLATQILTQTGGWPNNVFMTPDLKPFHAAVYLPPRELMQIAQTISAGWVNGTAILKARADKVSGLISRYMKDDVAAQEVTPKAITKAAKTLIADFDEFNGGFGTAPKFPREMRLLFLLDTAVRNQDKALLEAVTGTLDAMLNGGIQDHVAGGFHRYAIDNEWRVPHFEKMLYNQALISMVLTQAWRLTGNERYKRASQRTLDYAIAQMRHAKGGFISAYDADSAKGEGAYYTYSFEEMKSVLGADFAIAQKVFNISAEGNFEGRNIVYLSQPPADIAKELKLSPEKLQQTLERLNGKLSVLRDIRQSPHRDDKILSSWNGLMVTALVDAAQAYKVENYAAVAKKTADFIWNNMGGSSGALKRSWFSGKADLDATQSDYAMTALAFIALSDTAKNTVWLERAKTLANDMDTKFRDKSAGDFFLTASANTFIRSKFREDGQIPSGNAIALEVFAALAERDADPRHKLRANRVLAALAGSALAAPDGGASTLRAADRYLRGPVSSQRSIAKGKVKISLQHVPASAAPGAIKVALKIAPGWHINAHKPLEDFFIPTELIATDLLDTASITYPAAVQQNLGFHNKPLALYEGDVQITANLKGAGDAGKDTNGKKVARFVELSLQACSDKVCLEPERVTLLLPAR